MKESKELVIPESAHPPAAPTVYEIFASLARDPSVDPGRIAQLMELRDRAERRDSEISFNRAMKAAQDEMVPVVRDAENPHTRSRYARLETIDRVIRPIYTKHGFSLSFNADESTEETVTVSAKLRHEMGYTADYKLKGTLDATGAQGKANKTSIQGLGSTVSYLRRYLTCMIFNVTLTNEDDDGAGAGPCITDQQANNIVDMFSATGMDIASQTKFLEFMNVRLVTEIRQHDYPRAMTALNAKLRKTTQGT